MTMFLLQQVLDQQRALIAQANPSPCGTPAPSEPVSQGVPEGTRTHELKTDPAVFAAVLAGAKTHEIRLNDRGFTVGDKLLLRETKDTGWEMTTCGVPLVYTGRSTERIVSHIQTGYGLAEGWCILSFAPTAPSEPTALSKLCDQLDSMKRTMFLRPGTGQNYSYLVHEDVAADVKQARDSAVYPTFHHPDDSAVDRFAAAMKAKMAASRAKGRGGWDNEVLCPVERLQSMLRDHIAKGDPVDVANFCMMLHARAALISKEPT